MSNAVMPTGETVTVSSCWNSSGSAYHTEACQAVNRMHAPKRVDISVAEWKGYHECERCQALAGGDK